MRLDVDVGERRNPQVPLRRRIVLLQRNSNLKVYTLCRQARQKLRDSKMRQPLNWSYGQKIRFWVSGAWNSLPTSHKVAFRAFSWASSQVPSSQVRAYRVGFRIGQGDAGCLPGLEVGWGLWTGDICATKFC